jgi:hypothetical protein
MAIAIVRATATDAATGQVDWRRADMIHPSPARLQAAALIIVIAAGLWLAGVGALMAFRPSYCLELSARMKASLEASKWRLQITEQGLRILAGAALVIRAPASKLPMVLEVAGWILVASSVLILVLPVRWHGTYGGWWVGRIAPLAVRVLSAVPVLVSAGLIYAVV